MTASFILLSCPLLSFLLLSCLPLSFLFHFRFCFPLNSSPIQSNTYSIFVDRYRLPRYDECISNTESVSLHEYHPVEKPFQTNRFSASDVFSPAGISFCSLEFRLYRTEYPIDTGSRTYSIRLSICEFILQRAEGSSYRHLSGCRTGRCCRSAVRRSEHDD